LLQARDYERVVVFFMRSFHIAYHLLQN
jgi:hypothetical protein